MANETVINEEFSDDRAMEISGDEASSKVSGLNQKIGDLERENETIFRENTEYKQRIEAIDMEKGLLVAKVDKLRDELEVKENEIQVLKKNVGELKAMVGSSMSMEKLKDELEKNIEKMKVEISVMENALDEKEKVISEYEIKERAFLDGVHGREKGLIGAVERDWLFVGASTIAVVAVIGVTCYVHASRKH